LLLCCGNDAVEVSRWDYILDIFRIALLSGP